MGRDAGVYVYTWSIHGRRSGWVTQGRSNRREPPRVVPVDFCLAPFAPLSTTLYHFDPLPTTLYHWARKPRRKALPNQDSPLFPQTDRVFPRVPLRAARFPAPNSPWLTWMSMIPGAPTSYYITLCVYTGCTRFFYGCTIGYMCFL